MPSKAQQAAADDNMFAVEELVHEIKENLRLKAPATNTGIVLQHRSLRRPSPYSVPSRSYVVTPRSGLITNSTTSACDPDSSSPSYAGGDCGTTSTAMGGGGGGGGSEATSSSHLQRHVVSAKVHCHPHHRKRNKSTDDIDDPYEMLQALLKNNSLVKEAVRRLQLNLSPKQRYFYESDEESSRSPMMRMCQLEL